MVDAVSSVVYDKQIVWSVVLADEVTNVTV
jgi:hypothetical protein